MLKLAYKNFKNRRLRSILLMIGISIGIASVIIFVGFTNGLKKTILEKITGSQGMDLIQVIPETSGNRLLKLIVPSSNSVLSEEKINEIKTIPHIKKIYREYGINKPISINASVFGQKIITDSIVLGVDEELLQEEFSEKKDLKIKTDEIPFILSRKLLDLYNFSIAPTNNLPFLKEEDFLNQNIQILVGLSSWIPSDKKTEKILNGKLVAFSDRTSIIALTIPLEALNFFGNENERILNKIHLKIDSVENVDTVANKIEEMGLKTDHIQKQIRQMQSMFGIFFLGLSTISATILFIAVLSILNSFFSSIRERRQSIGILRSLGAKRKQILALFLFEATIVGFYAGILGMIIAFFSSKIIDFILEKFAEPIFLEQKSLFIIDLKLLAFSLFLSIFLSIIGAIIPAYKASKLETIEALKN